MAYFENQNGVSYDELIGGTAVAALNANISITAAAAPVARGTLLTSAGVKVAKAGEASYILAADIKTGDQVATVFTRGQFNREALIVAEGDTVEAHEEQLRKVGIYLTSLK